MASSEVVAQLIADIIDDLVSRGVDDYIALAEVLARVKENASLYEIELSEVELAEVSLKVIDGALRAGLMEIGSWEKGRDFEAWGLDAPSSIQRARGEWEGLSQGEPDMRDLWFLWLADTPLGAERGLAVRDQVNRRFNWPPD